LPWQAKGSSARAAKAFAVHFVETVNYASETGDVGPLTSVSSTDCTVCSGIADRITEVYGSGGHLEGDGWTVISTQVLEQPGRDRLVALGLSIAKERRFASAEATPVVSEPTKGNLDVHVRPHEGSWVITRLVPNA
jgi:hypothetical protein